MKIIYGASKHLTLACGVVTEGGVSMPFFGLASTGLLDVSKMDTTDAVKDQFDNVGMTVLFDNPQAAEIFMHCLQSSFATAEKLDWADREMPQGGTQ